MTELTCKDLMVEDWVQILDDETWKEYKIAQVYSIRKDGRLACITESGSFAAWNIKYIAPILLTPKILEKNFESVNNDFGFQDYKLNDDFLIENRGTRFCFVRRIAGCGKYRSTFYICELNFVHQLQHALRLCGIEKEIVL